MVMQTLVKRAVEDAIRRKQEELARRRQQPAVARPQPATEPIRGEQISPYAPPSGVPQRGPGDLIFGNLVQPQSAEELAQQPAWQQALMGLSIGPAVAPVAKTLEAGYAGALAGASARKVASTAKSYVTAAARGPEAQAVVPVRQATTAARKRISTQRPSATKPVIQPAALPPAAPKAGPSALTQAAAPKPTVAGAPPIEPPVKGGTPYRRLFGNATKPPIEAGDRMRRIQEQVNDTVWGLRKMQSSAEAKGAVIEPGGRLDLTTNITRAPGAINAALERHRGILEQIGDVAKGTDTNDIDDILGAMHWRDVLAQKPGRMTPGGLKDVSDLDQVLVEMQQRLGPDGYAKALSGAKVVQQAYKAERIRLAGEGLISKEVADVLDATYPWYNPIEYVDKAEALLNAGRSAKPFSVIASGVRRLGEKGVKTAARSPLDLLPEQLIRNETRIVKNQVASSIIKLAEADGLAVKKVARGGIGTLSYFENGTRQIYQVPEWIFREADTLTRTIHHPAISFLGALNGVSRAGFTAASPVFIGANIANDMLTAFVSRGVMPWETGRRIALAFRTIENDKLRQAFRLSGGLQARFITPSGEQLAKQVIESGGTVVNGRTVTKKILGAIPELGGIGEQAPREALFERELTKNLPGWRSMTPEAIAATPAARKAAADAVELTINFARGGFLIKSANPLVLFLNASMEGTKLPFRVLRNNPNARWRLAGAGVASAGLTMYNLSYPEYFDIPDNIRHGSVVVMLPPKEKDSNGNWKPNYLTVIPRTREWGLFLGSIGYTLEQVFASNPEDFGIFTRTMLPSVTPFSENLLPGPEVFREVYEQAANWDFYRNAPIVPTELQSVPAEQQVMPWTSRSLQAVGERTNLSPMRIQHGISSVLGGAGMSALSVSDYILNLLKPREVSPEIQELRQQYEAIEESVKKRAFMTALDPDTRDALVRELRQPDSVIPIAAPIARRFAPGVGGQLRRTGERLAEEETGVPALAAAKVQLDMQKFSDRQLGEQQALDRVLLRSGDGKQWREARSDLGTEARGALKLAGIQAGLSTEIDRTAFYDAIASLAGSIPDRRGKGQVLLAGYYAIQPVEKEAGNKDFNLFFAAREGYLASLNPEESAILKEELDSRRTFIEREFEDGRDGARDYWKADIAVLAQFGKPELLDEYDTYKKDTPENQRIKNVMASVNYGFTFSQVDRMEQQVHRILRIQNPDWEAFLLRYGYVDTPASPVNQRRLVSIRDMNIPLPQVLLTK